MNNHNPIKKRIEELRKEEKIYILFYERFLLEGTQVGLGRTLTSMRYTGDRFTDYGVEPPKVIEINGSVVCSNLEKMFEVLRWDAQFVKKWQEMEMIMVSVLNVEIKH